jgi:hypothetical protein
MFLSPVLKHTDLSYWVKPPTALMTASTFYGEEKCCTGTRSCLDKYTNKVLCAYFMNNSLHLPESTVPGTSFPKYSRIRSSSRVSKAFQNSRSSCRPFQTAFEPMQFFKLRMLHSCLLQVCERRVKAECLVCMDTSCPQAVILRILPATTATTHE